MKKYLFLFWTISLLAACSTTNDHDAADDIMGDWVWLESSGGLAGTTETPESTQKIVELKITNHSIKKFINGTLNSDQSYKIDRRESVIYGDDREMIIYKSGFRQIFSTTGNQLFLIGDCNDCFQAKYVRK